MTDPLAGQVSEGDAPAAIPSAAPVPDIEARLTQMQQQLDERVKGFQRALNEKDAALKTAQQEALDLRMSGMSEDEKASLQWQQLQETVTRLTQENELLALTTEYPEEVPIFNKIRTAKDAKEQLELIRSFRAEQKAKVAVSLTQANPAEGEPEIPDVDLNNPMARPDLGDGTVMFNGQPVTEDWADKLLKSVRRMR